MRIALTVTDRTVAWSSLDGVDEREDLFWRKKTYEVAFSLGNISLARLCGTS